MNLAISEPTEWFNTLIENRIGERLTDPLNREIAKTYIINKLREKWSSLAFLSQSFPKGTLISYVCTAVDNYSETLNWTCGICEKDSLGKIGDKWPTSQSLFAHKECIKLIHSSEAPLTHLIHTLFDTAKMRDHAHIVAIDAVIDDCQDTETLKGVMVVDSTFGQNRIFRIGGGAVINLKIQSLFQNVSDEVGDIKFNSLNVIRKWNQQVAKFNELVKPYKETCQIDKSSVQILENQVLLLSKL